MAVSPTLSLASDIHLTQRIVHHLPAADSVVVMDKGSVVFKGTYDQLRSDTGLLHLVQETSQPSQKSGEKSEDGPVKEDHQQEKKATDVEDEAMQSYNNKGWHPYKFWARMAGLHRVVLSLVMATSWTLLSLGMNVRSNFLVLQTLLMYNCDLVIYQGVV